MERFIQQNCNKHPTEQIFLLRFHKEIDQVMSCAICIEEQNELSGICNMSLISFLNSDDQTLFPNWPPFFKEYLQKSKQNIKEIIQKKDKYAEIESLFQELKENVIQKINEIQKVYLQITVDQDTINEEILNEYNQISRKQQIKEILKDNQQSVDLKNQKFKLIVDEVLNCTHQNSQKVINIIEKNQKQQKRIMVNFTELEKRINEILDDHLIKLQNQNIEMQESKQILSENINKQLQNPSFYLIGSNYQNSQQNSSINQNTLIAKDGYTSSYQIQAYSNIILEHNKEYDILVELIQNDNRSKCRFGFGLIQNYKLNENCYDQKLMYYSCSNNYGISQTKKGQNLSNFDISKKINQFKIKICIKDNILEVSDFPNQEHIIAFDNDQNIDKSKNYRFCVNLPSKYKQGDWIKATLLSVLNKSN